LYDKLGNIASSKEQEDDEYARPRLYEKLELRDLTFAYRDATGKITYQFGPINLKVKKGQVLFIIGDNGSGKSTMLKLLSGLYLPDGGELLWDDIDVDRSNIESYRELFSVIFTDYHLFDRLFGLDEFNSEHAQYLLELLELNKVTKLDEGQQFSSTKLSAGQKKRLAMFVSFLYKKDIYVLDEVAADQDPGYRRFFYYTVLPELKKAGKTVIVVSHDDNYFHTADRIIHLKQGKVHSFKKKSWKSI